MALLTQSIGGSNALKVTTYSGSGTPQLFLNTAPSATFTDISPYSWTITNTGSVTYYLGSPTSGYPGCASFNGTNYLSNGGANLTLASSSTPFTVEAWIYPTAITGFTGGTVCPIISIGNESGSGGRMAFGLSGDNSGQLGYNYFGYPNENLSSAGAIAVNTWQHVAFVSDGTTVTGYVNGVSTGSFTIGSFGAGVGGNGGGFYIGGSSTGGQYTGLITSLRYVNGTAVYKRNFTRPTPPLSVVTGSAGTFTPKVSGGSFCRITLVGGGGGGGGGSIAGAQGQGGGGGATLVYWQYVTAATSYTVGAGGNGGLGDSATTEGAAGTNGGTTSFGTLVAPGGNYGYGVGGTSGSGGGGGICAVPVSQVSSTNVTGYFAASTNIVYTGFQNGIRGVPGGGGGTAQGSAPGFAAGVDNGSAAAGSGGNLNRSAGGGGGDSPYGSGGAGGAASGTTGYAGASATGYGGGGGGGGGSGTNMASGTIGGDGGNGSAGLIIIEEFGAQG
jgi:hypothetical protein